MRLIMGGAGPSAGPAGADWRDAEGRSVELRVVREDNVSVGSAQEIKPDQKQTSAGALPTGASISALQRAQVS